MKRNDAPLWEITAYTEEGDANRPTATHSFNIPAELYVEKEICPRGYCDESICDSFCWKLKWNSGKSERNTVSPNGEILPAFVRLANEKTPQDFANKVELFARKWGNLDLCEEHQMPASHNYNCEPSIPHKKVVLRPFGSLKASEESKIFGESLSAWREYSIFAQSLLNIAANLQGGDLGEDNDWDNLHKFGGLGWSHIKAKQEKSYQIGLLEFEQKLIADRVNYWMAIGNLRPEIRWENNDIVILFKTASPYGSLFAYLALQIMLAVGKQDGLAICSSCGTPYVPKRKPVRNKRRFCSQCEKSGRPQALASADYRKRKYAK